ncbi:probable D-lactate dehydrogenase, mitochondrial [Anaerolineaceae bacterium]|nr:probable D-lactate dehydrogenase, mitochondrial [Anaerolineaceae bacterium]
MKPRRQCSELWAPGLTPPALELLDTATVTAINNADALGLHPSPTLFVEFHAASEATLAAELGMVEEICRELQCSSFQSGVGRAARDQLWAARHGLGELFKRIHPGQGYLITDVAVPISQYAALVAEGTTILAQLKGSAATCSATPVTATCIRTFALQLMLPTAHNWSAWSTTAWWRKHLR